MRKHASLSPRRSSSHRDGSGFAGARRCYFRAFRATTPRLRTRCGDSTRASRGSTKAFGSNRRKSAPRHSTRPRAWCPTTCTTSPATTRPCNAATRPSSRKPCAPRFPNTPRLRPLVPLRIAPCAWASWEATCASTWWSDSSPRSSRASTRRRSSDGSGRQATRATRAPRRLPLASSTSRAASRPSRSSPRISAPRSSTCSCISTWGSMRAPVPSPP